jgi:hypothetical protein
MRYCVVPTAASAVTIAALLLFTGSVYAANPPSTTEVQPYSVTASQPAVGDDVHIAGQVLGIQQYFADNGAEIHRFTVSRPTIDGVSARSAYLTACTGTEGDCAANGYSAVSTEGVGLGSWISADGEITAISVKRYYSTYYLNATSDVLETN